MAAQVKNGPAPYCSCCSLEGIIFAKTGESAQTHAVLGEEWVLHHIPGSSSSTTALPGDQLFHQHSSLPTTLHDTLAPASPVQVTLSKKARHAWSTYSHNRSDYRQHILMQTFKWCQQQNAERYKTKLTFSEEFDAGSHCTNQLVFNGTSNCPGICINRSQLSPWLAPADGIYACQGPLEAQIMSYC